MKRIASFIVGSLIAGLLVVVPLYLAVLLLLKGMASLAGLVRPFTSLLPDWLPAEHLLSLGLVLLLCFLVGVIVRTRAGRSVRERVETSLFDRIPGYAVFRSLTLQLVGQGRENAWKPAFVEIEEALVPAFIIEEHEDGRFTVFVPSSPRHSRVPSMCSAGSGSTRWMFRSLRRSSRSRAGERGAGSSSLP